MIDPALSPDEWRALAADGVTRKGETLRGVQLTDLRVTLGFHAVFVDDRVGVPIAVYASAIPAVLASLNAALPNDHPLKITQADVTDCETAAILAGVEAVMHDADSEPRREFEETERKMRALAAKLSALLSPER